LAVVVNKERPDLEAMKAKLIVEQNEFKIKLKDLEDDLLRRLAAAEVLACHINSGEYDRFVGRFD